MAFIGNSDYGYQGEEIQLNSFIPAIMSETHYHLGQAFNIAAGLIETGYDQSVNPGQITVKDNDGRLNLLGDPEMPVWTNTPGKLSVTVSPAAVTNGSDTIKVSLSDLPTGRTAVICLQKYEQDSSTVIEAYSVQRVTGNGTYSFLYNAETNGNINVTVTAKNFTPYETLIPVTTNSGDILSIDHTGINDSNNPPVTIGNGDQIIDAGETVALSVYVINTGKGSANNVTATVSCNDTSELKLLNSTLTFGNISAGSMANAVIRFTVNKNTPALSENSNPPLSLTLVLSDNVSNTFKETFNLNVEAPVVEFVRAYNFKNNGVATTIIRANDDISFDIELLNSGNAPVTEVSAILSSSIVTCNSTPGTYGDVNQIMEVNSSYSNSFSFAVPSTYRKNAAIPCTLNVTNQFGKVWTFAMNLNDYNISSLDSASLGLSNTAGANAVTLNWTSVTNANQYDIYRSKVDSAGNPAGYILIGVVGAGSPDVFVDQGDSGSGLGVLTTYRYEVVATESGVEIAEASLLAWTSLPQEVPPIVLSENGIAITGAGGAINLFDTIYNGNKEKEIVFSAVNGSQGYIFAFHGLDLTPVYTWDRNTTDVAGFSKLTSCTATGNPPVSWSTPAIADVNHDGLAEFISESSWDEAYYNSRNDLQIFKNNTDTNPLCIQLKGIQYYSEPLVADVDNDGNMDILVKSAYGIFHRVLFCDK